MFDLIAALRGIKNRITGRKPEPPNRPARPTGDQLRDHREHAPRRDED